MTACVRCAELEAKLAEAERQWHGWMQQVTDADNDRIATHHALEAAESREKALREALENLGEGARWMRTALIEQFRNPPPSVRLAVEKGDASLLAALDVLAAGRKDPPPGPPSSPDRCACGAVSLLLNPDPQALVRDPLTRIVHARQECRAALAPGDKP